MAAWEDYLKKIYFDPSHPASFAGPQKLYKEVKDEGKYHIGMHRIRKFLHNQEAFSLHKPVRRRFQRNHVISAGKDDLWMADLIDMVKFDKWNKGYKYILLVIDTFSKYVWLRPLKSKTGEEVARVFKDIFTKSDRMPKKLITDKALNGESNYVRWGREQCPGNGTTTLYSGFTAGSYWTASGGAANFLCLPADPQWAYYEDSVTSGAQIFGTEYELGDIHSNGGSSYFGTNVRDEDAPCAVCSSPRSNVVMIPARLDCYPGWTKEYSGYLMAGNRGHNSATDFVCVDSKPEVVFGGHPDQEGRLLYLVEGKCGALKCPPYVNGRELTCVVCTK